MGNLRLGDWSIEVPGYSPEIGDTFSRDILGATYQTVIMPDGKEWMSVALSAPSLGGQWWGGGVADDGDGRYYADSDLDSVDFGSWRIPTESDMDALQNACMCGFDKGNAGPICTVGRWWDGRGEIASDLYGFSASPTGAYNPVWGWGGKSNPAASYEKSYLWHRLSASGTQKTRPVAAFSSPSALSATSLPHHRPIDPAPTTY